MAKRGPTSELNHDNWDQEDSEDENVKGEFQQAAPEELQKRVIRVAKRRSVNPNSPANSPFSGFKGFGTTKTASPATPNFNFVSGGLKNGHSKENELVKEEIKTPVTEAKQKETLKASTSKASTSSGEPAKAGSKRCRSGSIEDDLGSPDYYAHLKSLNLSVASWINKHLDDNPFCILTPVFKDYERHLETINKKILVSTADSEPTPEIKHVETKASPARKTLPLDESKTSTKIFPSITLSDSSPESKEKPLLPSTGSIFAKITSSPTSSSSSSSLMFKLPDTASESPGSTDSGKTSAKSAKSSASDFTSPAVPVAEFSTPALQTPALSSSPSVFQTPALTTPSLFGGGNVFGGTKSASDNKTFNPSSLTFSFGASAAASAADKTSTAPTFGTSVPSFGSGTTSAPSFGSGTTQAPAFGSGTASAPAFGSGTSSAPPFGSGTTGSSVFSFGSGAAKPSSTVFGNSGSIFGNGPPAGGFGSTGMSFGSLAATTLQNQSEKETEEENEEPPKVEFNPIKEENAVYETICKVYVLKDGEYKDRGKGQLYIKKANGKSQLLARAATTTGQILLNVLLNSSVPTSRPATGKNSVLIMCIPTPGNEKPTAVLVRVKSDAEADTLLAKLEEHKKSDGGSEKKD